MKNRCRGEASCGKLLRLGVQQRLDLDREKLLSIAAALNKMGSLSGAAKAYATVIGSDAGEIRAVKGLLNVANRIAKETKNVEAAAKVYRYLIERCPQ